MAEATVSWDAPLDDGGLPITGYTVTSDPGAIVTPWNPGPLEVVVTGLTPYVEYTFTVTATNDAGVGAASVASNPVTPGFDPLTLSPGLWLDASNAGSITESGGLVSQWDDLSGNSRHVMAAGGLRPTTGVTTVNALNVLDFAGAQKLQGAASSAITNQFQTWFVVFVATDNGAGGNRCVLGMGPTAGPLQQAIYWSGTQFFDWSNFGQGQIGLTRTASDKVLLMVAFDQASTQTYMVHNNVLKGAFAGNPNNTVGPGATDVIAVGNFPENGAAMAGSVCEVLAFPTILSAGDQAAVNSYLELKWDAGP